MRFGAFHLGKQSGNSDGEAMGLYAVRWLFCVESAVFAFATLQLPHNNITIHQIIRSHPMAVYAAVREGEKGDKECGRQSGMSRCCLVG